MSGQTVATRITSSVFPAESLTLTIANGEPVTVYGVEFTNDSGGALTVTVNNGAGTKQCSFDILDTATVEWSVPALWDAGFQIVASGAGLHAVVFHNNSGA